jgi:hypothetical protein
MHARTFIHETLQEVSPDMHQKRLTVLSEMVSAALSQGRLTVTGLGRAIQSEAHEKHCIKRADRLLSNVKLQRESLLVYGAMTARILKKVCRPTIVVDWSTLNERDGLYLLRASTPVNGRALTLYEEVHTLAEKDKPKVHRKFLLRLQQVLPPRCHPIIITDAGFRTPWFKEVLRHGWDFIGRIRNRHMVQLGTDWILSKSLHGQATRRPTRVGRALLTRENPIRCELVLYRTRAKGRMETTIRGKRAQRRQSRKHAAREREPWLLATSLPAKPRDVVTLYQTRMQIEEAFRDLKSSRYGLSLEFSATKKAPRMALLVLIGSLALWFSWLLGKATEVLGQHRHLQANSVRCRTVLSPVFLGLRIFDDTRIQLTRRALSIAQQLLSSTVRYFSYAY